MLQKRLKEFAEIDKRVDVVNGSFPIKRTHREFIVVYGYAPLIALQNHQTRRIYVLHKNTRYPYGVNALPCRYV